MFARAANYGMFSGTGVTTTLGSVPVHSYSGGGDLMVRWYANALKDLTGKPVLVENKVGANGHVGDQAAMDARPITAGRQVPFQPDDNHGGAA